MSQSRQLAAIMFTDIVGYTALMGHDEEKAFIVLNKNRELQKPFIQQFNGRWIKELGDGVMTSFNTVSDAVNAAIKIMEACNEAKDFQLRIGIHLGDIVFENDDVFGDGVNIASRIQSAAKPGCIYISESVHHNVSNKKNITTKFIKEETLKNVKEPVRMYEVMITNNAEVPVENKIKNIAQNSIAVLPFVNMSNDPDQEYFSDGISEDIINMLSQVPGLKVTGRTSSFSFKGKNQDLRLIGEQLSVNYILEGSVRKSGNKLRITAQLIKVADGYHLYSEKFDRELEDIFQIQDEISLAILNSIKMKLFGKEKEEKEAVLLGISSFDYSSTSHSLRTPVFRVTGRTDNVEAYQLYLQGLFYFNKFSPDAFKKAIEYFEAAIKIDPGYALAYAGMAHCYYDLSNFSWLPREQCLPQAITAAHKALQLDEWIAESHIAMGQIKLWYEWDFTEAAYELKKGIRLNPNSIIGLRQLGILNIFMNKYEEAHKYIQKADNLDPFSLLNLYYLSAYYWCEGNLEKGLEYADRLNALEPSFFGGHHATGIVHLVSNRFEEATTELELAVKLNGDLATLSSLAIAYGMTGKKMKAQEILEKMKSIEGIQNEGNTFFAQVHAAMGEWDKAFEYFDKALELHEGVLLMYKNVFRDYFPEMMQDPRTKNLLERIGLPFD